MEATYTVTASARTGVAGRSTVKTILRAIAAVFAEGTRGGDFERHFATPNGAEFAALPRSHQSKALDHGARPLSG